MRKTIPYSNTKIAPEQTKADIEKLLKEHGVKDIQWTTYQSKTTLQFIWRVTVKGVEREIAFCFAPPNIQVGRRLYNPHAYRTEKVQMLHEPAAYRILWWYLKAKLEAVQFGLETLEKEFMSHILVSLPDGSSVTFGERLDTAIQLGHVESTFALPEPKKQERNEVKVIDVAVNHY